MSTRLSTDKATSLHRLIRDEIPSQALQPLPDPWPQPDQGGKGWHRIVATALHLPGGPGGWLGLIGSFYSAAQESGTISRGWNNSALLQQKLSGQQGQQWLSRPQS